MRKISIEIHPFSALVGAAAVALVLSFVSAAQVGPASGYSGRLSQPLGSTTANGIKPEDMVWITSLGQPGATDFDGSITIQPGDSVVAYQVPADKHFVLIDIESVAGWGGSGAVVRLEELDSGGATFPVFSDRWLTTSLGLDSAPLGVAFSPGSQIIVRNIGSNTLYGSYDILGYLVDA